MDIKISSKFAIVILGIGIFSTLLALDKSFSIESANAQMNMGGGGSQGMGMGGGGSQGMGMGGGGSQGMGMGGGGSQGMGMGGGGSQWYGWRSRSWYDDDDECTWLRSTNL